MKREYQICKRCIMDTTISEIEFDKDDICNFCRRYEERAKAELHHDEEGQKKLSQVVKDMKDKGKNKKYDCITI